MIFFSLLFSRFSAFPLFVPLEIQKENTPAKVNILMLKCHKNKFPGVKICRAGKKRRTFYFVCSSVF